MRRISTLRALARAGLVPAALVALLPFAANASEPLPTRAERIPSPGRSIVSDETGEAMALNPANLAYAPAAELRWTGVRCPDTQKVGCGHSFTASTPLLFGVAAGLRVDYASPPSGPDGVGFPYNGLDYTWITLGLGFHLSDTLAFGTTLQRSYSPNAYTDALFGITAGLTYRPYTRFGFAAVVRDFNNPAPARLLPNGEPILDRSYALGMAFRPTGTRAAELGLETRYLEGSDQWLPKATAVLEIPGVGRARGDVEVAHLGNDQRRGVVATAGLEFSYTNVSVGGGMLFGSGLGTPQSIGEYATIAFSAYTNPGIPRLPRAVWIRTEHTPGTRGHVALLRRLWSIAEEKDVSVVTMVLRAEPAATYAHAEELADAFRLLKAKGKKVLCAWEDGGPRALYACASANRIVVNPAGGVRYAGIKTTYFYLAKLLDNLGVKAEFVRIGPHKTAPEQFTNEHASEVARADHEDLLRQFEAVFVKNLSIYRKLPEEKVREATLRGPFFANEARDAGFVDGLAFDDELERVTQDLAGRKLPYEQWSDETKSHSYFSSRDKVALLYIDGDIVDGRSARIPLLDLKLVGSYTIAETAKKLREDPEIKSVVLRIESPGGSSLASDVMWRELKLLADKKPLIVSMGSIAASGGYYVAAPAREIYALPLTVTGSIGVFYGKADISGLLKKIGVGVETYKTTPRADAESFFRPFTDEEKVELKKKVEQTYDLFLSRVAEGRHLPKAQIDAVGQGRVWSGQQAFDAKLVDKLGGLRDALSAARNAAGLPADAPIVEYPEHQLTLFERVLDMAGLKAEPALIQGLPVQIKDVARAIAPMVVYTGETPLARMEWVPLENETGKDEP